LVVYIKRQWFNRSALLLPLAANIHEKHPNMFEVKVQIDRLQKGFTGFTPFGDHFTLRSHPQFYEGISFFVEVWGSLGYLAGVYMSGKIIDSPGTFLPRNLAANL